MKYHIILLAVATTLTGCAAPKIDTSKLARPKTVAIDDFPDMNHTAIIGPVVTRRAEFFFNGRMDPFFKQGNASEPGKLGADYAATANQVTQQQILNSPKPMSVGQAGMAGAVGGAMGALLQASAEDTMKKAMEFDGLVRKNMHNADLRAELIASLRQELEARGIQVQIAAESRNLPPRLHWAAITESGEKLPVGSLADSPSIDADVLLQIVPLAAFAAPGPLNSFEPRIAVGVALFDGRTRKFLGWQAIEYDGPAKHHSYMRYDSMVGELDQTAPQIHDALLTLAPKVAELVAGPRR